MMKRFKLACIALMAICLTGCDIFGDKPVSVNEADLIGRWEAPSKKGEGNIVFMFGEEPCEEEGFAGYKIGYTYDEGDDVTLEDLMEDYLGNGWFAWKLNGSDINTYQMMNISSGVTPTTYHISSFKEGTMTMRDGNGGKTYTLTHVVIE